MPFSLFCACLIVLSAYLLGKIIGRLISCLYAFCCLFLFASVAASGAVLCVSICVQDTKKAVNLLGLRLLF